MRFSLLEPVIIYLKSVGNRILNSDFIFSTVFCAENVGISKHFALLLKVRFLLLQMFITQIVFILNTKSKLHNNL